MHPTNNLILSHDIGGPKDGETLVLLHAIGTNRHLWDRQWHALCQTYRVIRCDLPGHGLSPDAVPDQTIFAMAASVQALIAHLGVSKAHVIGSSLGGMIGLALAIKNPQCVRSLIAADVRADAPEAYRAMWDDLIAMAKTDGMGAVAYFMLTRWFGDASGGCAQDIDAVSGALRATTTEGFKASACAIQKMDFADRLGQIHCPTLLLVGETDGVLPQLMSEMTGLISGAQFKEIADAGHLPNIDQPKAFLDAVIGFLSAQRETHRPAGGQTAFTQGFS